MLAQRTLHVIMRAIEMHDSRGVLSGAYARENVCPALLYTLTHAHKSDGDLETHAGTDEWHAHVWNA